MSTATLARFGSIDGIEEEQVTEQIRRRVLSGEQGMIVWWRMQAGVHAAAHAHPHEQMVWMIKGRMKFRIGDETRDMGPGEVALIPGGVEHEGWIMEDSEVVDVFAPPRADFLAGGAPAYMAES